MDVRLPALAFGPEVYSVGMVMAMARLAELTTDVEVELEDAISGLKVAMDQGALPPAEVIQAAFDGWRSERGLTSGDQLEAWLSRHRLDSSSVAGFLRRRLVLAAMGPDRTTLRQVFRPAPELVDRMLADELCLAGALPYLVEEAAKRVVAPPAPAAEFREAQHLRMRRFEARGGVARMLAPFDAGGLQRLLGPVVHFELWLKASLGPAEIDARLRRRGRDLAELRYLTIDVDDRHAARELAALLREVASAKARETLDETSGVSGLVGNIASELKTERRRIKDVLKMAVGPLLADARVAGPVQQASGRWRIWYPLSIVPAVPGDPEIRRLLEHELSQELLSAGAEQLQILYR